MIPKLEIFENTSESQPSEFQKQVQHSQILAHQQVQNLQQHQLQQQQQQQQQHNSPQRMPQIRVSTFASQSANASNIANVLNQLQQQQKENELQLIKNNNDSNVNKNTNNTNSDVVNSLSDSVTLSPRTNTNLSAWIKLEQQKFLNSNQQQQQQSPGMVAQQQVTLTGINSLIDLHNNNNSNNNNNNSSNSSSHNNLPTTPTSSHKSSNSMRRRVRRKHNSPDDQAEALTEMSVRGLNLFRYASIQDGVYQCTECAKDNVQKTFKNKYSFQRHAFLYHEGTQRKVFPCPVCRKEFSRPDKMKNHMKTTHECYIPKDCNFPIPLIMATTAAQQQLPADLSTSTVAQSNPTNFLTSQLQAAVQSIPSLPQSLGNIVNLTTQ